MVALVLDALCKGIAKGINFDLTPFKDRLFCIEI